MLEEIDELIHFIPTLLYVSLIYKNESYFILDPLRIVNDWLKESKYPSIFSWTKYIKDICPISRYNVE